MNTLEKAHKLVREQKIDALIIDNPLDLYYLTHLNLSLGRLLILKKEALLFVDGRYFEACKKESAIPVILTHGYGENSAFFHAMKKLRRKKVGFDTKYTSYAVFQQLDRLQLSLQGIEDPLTPLRMIKDKGEITKLKEATKLNIQGFHYARSLLKIGVTEEEVAAKLEIFYLKQGGEGIGFKPIIAFGANSAAPHHRAGNTKLRKNDTVLIDIGVIWDHYHSDMTRVVFTGKKDKEMEKIYAIVEEAKLKALILCQPGVLIKELDRAARGVIEKAGYGPFFPHSLGHGVGLEIHEFPSVRFDAPCGEVALMPGMCITIEPGIYLPGKGGVRLEDLILITKNGHQNLTASV